VRTEQAGQALLLKAYQQEISQRQVRGADRPLPAEENSATPEAEEGPRTPQELSKGRLLDIYG
jgi:hypothetical protein